MKAMIFDDDFGPRANTLMLLQMIQHAAKAFLTTGHGLSTRAVQCYYFLSAMP